MRGFKRSRPAGDAGSPRFAREAAEAEAAEELRRAMDRAGVPWPPAGVVATPEASAAPAEGAGAEAEAAEAPRPAVRRVRKVPPGGAARRSGGPPARRA